MQKDNLTFLQENLRYLGFGETLPFNDQLEHEVEKGQKDFYLTTEAHFDEWSKLEATLHFRKGGQQEMYFLTKYTAALWYFENSDLNKMQTFYIFKGAGVTLKEAFNLLQGRAVNKDLTDSEGEKYNAWIQLDFTAKTPMNNYRTRHYRLHQQGKPTSTNPIASIYAWTRGLQYRGTFDDTPDVVRFADTLEQVCVDVVESGQMTKDLAILIRADHPYLTTDAFMQAIDTELRKRMGVS